MYRTCKMHNQKCLDTYQDVSLPLLLIQSTPMDTGLPSTVTLLLTGQQKVCYLK